MFKYYQAILGIFVGLFVGACSTITTETALPVETPAVALPPSPTGQPSQPPRPAITATLAPSPTAIPSPTSRALPPINARQCSIGERVDSGDVEISSDGRWVVFASDAPYLVEGERNECHDIFLYDLEGDVVRRISNGWDGSESNGDSANASLSRDGRWIVFTSEASNLVEGDTNEKSDIFLYDRETDKTERISVAADGIQGNDESIAPVISASGRWVAFWSRATTLSQEPLGPCTSSDRGGDPVNCRNIHIYDLEQKQVMPLGVTVDAMLRNYGDLTDLSISDDGRWVLFAIHENDGIAQKVPYRHYVSYDRETNTLEPLVVTQGDESASVSIVSQSADGQWLLFESWVDDLVPADANEAGDVFLRNRFTNSVELVSVSPEDEQFPKDSGILHCFECAPYRGLALSDNGQWAVFLSERDDERCLDPFGPEEPIACYEFFLRDLNSGTTRRFLSSTDGGLLDGDSAEPRLSADGRWIVFTSVARNLLPVPQESSLNVFAYDQLNDTLKLLSGPN